MLGSKHPCLSCSCNSSSEPPKTSGNHANLVNPIFVFSKCISPHSVDHVFRPVPQNQCFWDDLSNSFWLLSITFCGRTIKVFWHCSMVSLTIQSGVRKRVVSKTMVLADVPLYRTLGRAGDRPKVTEPNLRFPARIFGFLRKICNFLRFPAPAKRLNFQEKG